MRKVPFILAVAAWTVFAWGSENPPKRYEAIPERNIFKLTNAPGPQRVEQPPTELPTLKLKGITTMLGDKRVVLQVQAPGANPGQGQESLILAEGQREGGVEVLNIDEQAGTVRVKNAGQPVTITFQEEPSPPPSGTAPLAQENPSSGVPGHPPALASAGGTNTNGTAAYTGSPATLPSALTNRRPNRRYGLSPQPPGATNLVQPGQVAVAGATNSTATLPEREDLTPEEQALLLQLQEQLAREQNQNQTSPPPPAPTGGSQQRQYQEQLLRKPTLPPTLYRPPKLRPQ